MTRKTRASKKHDTFATARPSNEIVRGLEGGDRINHRCTAHRLQASTQTPADKGTLLLAYLVASTAVPVRKAGELEALKPALCTMLGMYTKEQTKMTLEKSGGHQRRYK